MREEVARGGQTAKRTPDRLPSSTAKATWFWLLVVAQSAAVMVILWNGLPAYRQLLMVRQITDRDVIPIVAGAALVIQLSYWTALRLRLSVQLHIRPVLSHILLFVARLNFTFVGAMFSVVFFVQFESIELRLWKVLLLMAVLFSMFCYTVQLEWIGRCLSDDRGQKPA